MPADEVNRGTAVGESRARSGPRHAAPKKPLLTRIQVPAGKAIAVAAMPTAVLMGMGFTPTLARAEEKPSAKSLVAEADEYKDCVDALKATEEDKKASATPSPSASASESASDSKEEQSSSGDGSSGNGSSNGGTSGGNSSSDSGSDDKTEPTPSPSTSAPAGSSEEGPSTATPSLSEGNGNVLDTIGDAIKDIFTPDDKESEDATATPSASPSGSPTKDASDTVEDTKDEATDAVKDTTGKAEDTAKDVTGAASKAVEDTAKDVTDAASKAVEDTAKDVTDAASKAVEDTAKDVTGAASKAVEDTKEKAAEAAGEATASPTPTPSPSASEGRDSDDCLAATEEESGVEKGIPLLPDDPWYLEASSLTLKGADYQGIVKVRTTGGQVKRVLKYVVSDGSVIGDLHQIVKDQQAGKTYHVLSGKGEESTITGGKTVMYTESISGNLLGLIPLTFDPEHPPPINIPLIYFTNVKVTQAAQFGGTLKIPGMQLYTTD